MEERGDLCSACSEGGGGGHVTGAQGGVVEGEGGVDGRRERGVGCDEGQDVAGAEQHDVAACDWLAQGRQRARDDVQHCVHGEEGGPCGE